MSEPTPLQKLAMLDTSKLGKRTAVGAVIHSDSGPCEITIQLNRRDFEKMDPENVAIVQLEW